MSGGDYLTREQAEGFFKKVIDEARQRSFIFGAYDISKDLCPVEMMPRLLDNGTDMASHGFEIERDLAYDKAGRNAHYRNVLGSVHRDDIDRDPLPDLLAGRAAKLKVRVCWGDGESFDIENPEKHGGVVTVTLSDSKGTLHREKVYLWQDREPHIRTSARFLRSLYEGVHYVGSDE